MAWVPLESNPEVMNKFLVKMGVPPNVQVVDVFSLDPDMLDFIPQPVSALLLLFPCDDEYENHRKKQEEEIKTNGQKLSNKLFFVKQFVHNACGTIALIHSVANMEGISLNDGFIKKFLDETRLLDPVERGEHLQKNDGIITIHQEVALEGQTAPPDEREPVPYHFVAFVERDGSLYELDGRKEFPINHGDSRPESFLKDAATVCQDYMKRNPENVNFTICAITQSDDNSDADVEFTSLVEKPRRKGLSVLSAAIFIVGEMAGSGVLALPRAAVDSGWIGIVLVVVFCINAGYGGSRLGACWAILEERYPAYRNPVRNPYATIAYRAVGQWAAHLVSGCIQFTLFGAGTVYLLLASEIIDNLMGDAVPLSLCLWFPIIAIILLPLMLLGSPKDFPFVGVGALLTTVISCILIAISFMDYTPEKPAEPVTRRVHDFHDFFISFGTILFAYGGASTFPTIQNDMHDKEKFGTSVTIAFTSVIFLYLPVTIGGYIVFGESVKSNVLENLGDGPLIVVSNILMAIHLVFAFLIVINPVCQEVEEVFKVPHAFGTKRCVVRSLIMLTMLLVGVSVPKFGKILSLVGGSTITLLTFILPPFFYMRLCSEQRSNWIDRTIPLHFKVYMIELILLGFVGGTAATYSALTAIFSPDSLTPACWWPSSS